MSDPERPQAPDESQPIGAVRLRLGGALVALGAGTAALVIAILLVRSVLS